MSDDDRLREVKFQLVGWILFVICAGLFIAASLRSGDRLGLAASIVFLVACAVFMVPLISALRRKGGPGSQV